ncbi:MAG: DNA ligase, partial [Candidatus Aenigmarchaeota archaeon]|nr:DNA ligase [Candidatus Aenigmarchaeota archaeon]
MDYSELVEIYEKLSATTKKLEKRDIVAEFIKNLEDDELRIVIPLLQGKIFLESEGKEIGIADKLVIQALMKLGFSKNEVLDEFKDKGDLGLVAEILAKKKKQTTLFRRELLNVEQVFYSIRELADVSGKNSQTRKLNIILELLNSAEPGETKYITRAILEELRLGVAEGIMRDAVAQAFGVGKEVVEYAYNLETDFGEVACIAKEKGEDGLKNIKLEFGRPIKVMLAEKAENLELALEKAKEPAIEIKYDGMRTLVQKDKDKIWLFTRRLENVTKQ